LDILVKVDGSIFFNKAIEPSGFWGDNAVSVFEKTILRNGQHTLEIYMNESLKKKETYDYVYKGKISLQKGEVLVIKFDSHKKTFYF